MVGIVYFLSNPSMPGVIKIGFTTGAIEDRIRQLNTTGVPLPFEVVAMFKVRDPQECEKAIHECLGDYRINNGREFFKIGLKDSLERSWKILSVHINTEVTSGGEQIESNKQPKNHGLDKDQIFALQMLTHDARLSGMPVYALQTGGHWADNLTLEYKLASLKERGLVEELKRGRDKPSYWKVTSNGIKFMFENGLILEDLLREET